MSSSYTFSTLLFYVQGHITTEFWKQNGS